tara:strand:- start:272 stop:460 length:189 start_codon:yes stop_codon:yes gene_type:complete
MKYTDYPSRELLEPVYHIKFRIKGDGTSCIWVTNVIGYKSYEQWHENKGEDVRIISESRRWV